MSDADKIEDLRAEIRGLEALVHGLVLSLIQRRLFTPEMVIREAKHTEAQLQMMQAPKGTLATVQRLRLSLEDVANAEPGR